MFNDYLDLQKQEMIDNLIKLVEIPSIASAPEENMPFGKNVDDALSMVASLAKSMGFKAKNLGSCTEIIFGKNTSEKVYIAGHVDVVPAGDGWTGSPFQLAIRDGKMYGRGVLDDKGPSIAALYALKAIKELGYKPKVQIRLILGGNEENGMSDLADYIEKAGLPDYALTPDSGFPIINAEAGVLQGVFEAESADETGDVRLVSFHGGTAFNSVPDICRAVIEITEDRQKEVKPLLSSRSFKATDFEYYFNDNMLCMTFFGVSAHGSVPEKGDNACIKAAEFVKELLKASGSENSYISFITEYFSGDTEGKKLGLDCKDEIIGPLSVNVGICDYDAGRKSRIALDLRLPIKADAEAIEKKLSEIAKTGKMKYQREDFLESTYIPEDSDFLKKLAECYEEVTGKKSRFIAARGATYAKCFKGRGVAFGPIDEESREEGGNMHSADEYFSVDAFCNLAKIYALSIYKLWVKED